MRAIIGLTGVKESGKTTTYSIIKEVFPEAVEVTLAKRLKDVCSEVLGIPRNALDDQALKEKELLTPVCLTQENLLQIAKSFDLTPDFNAHIRPHIGVIIDTPRYAAQYIGTEVLRNMQDDIHCDFATKNLPKDGLFVVTDMRFPNEFTYFQSRHTENFFPTYIANYAAEAKVGPNSHSSERYILEIAKKCHRIDNNSTLEDLRQKVLEYVTGILDTQERKSGAAHVE